MKRKPSKHLQAPRPLSAGHAQSASKQDGRWVVRSIPGAHAAKLYRCPGCGGDIQIGVAHIVAWPQEAHSMFSASPIEERRHWHTGCWKKRR
ncbi:MAG: hypothetical protein ACRDAX_02175 [Propionibacteriaceae bacterium]